MAAHVSTTTPDRKAVVQWLSAAVDGELMADELSSFQELFENDQMGQSVLQEWHSYTAIGEVLRETNARCVVADSGDFLLHFRQYLAQEETHHRELNSSVSGFKASTAQSKYATGGAGLNKSHGSKAANDARFWKRAAGFASVAAVAALGSLVWFSQLPTSSGLVAKTNAPNAVLSAAANVDSQNMVGVADGVSQQWEPDARWVEYMRTHRQYAGDPYWASQRAGGVQRASFNVGQ